MRYIPKNKLTKPFTATTREFKVALSGVEYIGDVVKTSSGKYYAFERGDINQSKRLLKYAEEPTVGHAYGNEDLLPRENFYFDYVSQKGKELTYTTEIPEADYVLTEGAYTFGSYLRYFVKNNVTDRVFEIEANDFTRLIGQDKQYHWPSYTIVEIEWKVSGDVADKEISGYLVEGVETLNKRAVEEASKIIPELSNILTDYLEYHQ